MDPQLCTVIREIGPDQAAFLDELLPCYASAVLKNEVFSFLICATLIWVRRWPVEISKFKLYEIFEVSLSKYI